MAEQMKVFKDPIHGTIELHPLLVKIIDTPQFQRLRNIKQLGALSYVYPGATHSRFEHSIGVAYLAGELLKSIREKQPDLGITDWDVLCVQIAALCHDLGHGPFSHMFDLKFLPEARRLKATKQMHEDLSKKMIDHLMEKNDGLLEYMKDVRKEMTDEDKGDAKEIEELKNILKEDLDFIKDLIDPKKKDQEKRADSSDQSTGESGGSEGAGGAGGEGGASEQPEKTQASGQAADKAGGASKQPEKTQASGQAADKAGGASKQRPPSNPSEKRYILYEIVSNERNKIDVDKWDYFVRDCHYLGMKNSFDHERLIKSARACEVDEQWQICYRDKDVFNLYDMFYTRFSLHKRAYQHKVNYAIELMIKEAFLKADQHLSFGGKTLSTAIEDMGAYTKLTDTIFDQILNSTSAELQEARDILERIVKRNLYYCLGEFHSEDTLQVIKENWKTFHQGSPEEYIVDDVKFNYGKGANDPIEDVRFYNKRNPQQARAITRAEVSRLLPERFEEKLHRIYTKRTVKNRKDDEDAFENFKNKFLQKKKKLMLQTHNDALTKYNR